MDRTPWLELIKIQLDRNTMTNYYLDCLMRISTEPLFPPVDGQYFFEKEWWRGFQICPINIFVNTGYAPCSLKITGY